MGLILWVHVCGSGLAEASGTQGWILGLAWVRVRGSGCARLVLRYCWGRPLLAAPYCLLGVCSAMPAQSGGGGQTGLV